MRSGRLAALALAGSLAVSGCGADFESDAFSTDIAEGFTEVDPSTFGGTDPIPVGLGGATLENLATFGPDESGEMRAYVDVYRINDVPQSPIPGAAAGSTTGVNAEILSQFGASAGGVKPRSAELGGTEAIEMTSAPVAGSLGGTASSTRTLVASHEDDLYIVTQVSADTASLAQTAIGFTTVVDSWEWKD